MTGVFLTDFGIPHVSTEGTPKTRLRLAGAPHSAFDEDHYMLFRARSNGDGDRKKPKSGRIRAISCG